MDKFNNVLNKQFNNFLEKCNYSQICTWLSADSIRVCTSQDLVCQSDKREESMSRQCKPVEFISEAKLLGR